MGIQGFAPFVKKHFPNAYETSSISALAYRKCAIDLASYMYAWKIGLDERWIVGLIQMLILFKSNNLHCVVVLDSQAPVEKKETQASRRDARQQQVVTATQVRHDLENFKKDKTQTDLLKKTYVRVLQSRFEPSLLDDLGETKFDKDSVDFSKMKVSDIQGWLVKKQSQNISIDSSDLDMVRQILGLLSVPFVDAISEAEATCSYLCREHKVDFVISKDSDCVCYGCPTWVSNLNLVTGECSIVHYDHLLEEMGFSEEMLTDWCIACGCDYNQRIPNMGPSKMYNLIQKHKSLEELERGEPDIDCSNLKYRRTRELFAHMNTNFQIPFWNSSEFDLRKLEAFLVDRGCADQVDLIKHQWKPVQFVVETLSETAL